VHLGGLAARDAVVLGTGSTGKLVARPLREAGVGRLSVASRSQVRAAEVAAAVGGRPLRTADVPAALADADLLVTATGAAVPVVAAGPVRAARAQAGGQPLFVLDLGMPPDVEPPWGDWPASRWLTSPHWIGTWPDEPRRARSPRPAPSPPPRPPHIPSGSTKPPPRRSSPLCTPRLGNSQTPN
jgi:Shikimate / quinate 5-dehydrogenase